MQLNQERLFGPEVSHLRLVTKTRVFCQLSWNSLGPSPGAVNLSRGGGGGTSSGVVPRCSMLCSARTTSSRPSSSTSCRFSIAHLRGVM